VNEHVPDAERVQLEPVEKVPEEVGLSERLTVPVGVTAVPGDVSVTVTVQLVGVFIVVLVGLQTTVV
jgi:hypothetical protein